MARERPSYLTFETAMGFCAIAWNDAGIARFRLPEKSGSDATRAVLRRLRDASPADPTPRIAAAVSDAKRYFEGEAVDFSGVPVDLGAPDPFFAQVYDFVRKLKWGETTTYGAVARALGAGPEAACDVGQAMAQNPVPLIIPCHRVLAAGGKIGGFSAPGGSATKSRMLALEGVRTEPPPAQQAFGF